jgi:2-dehydro-3-deoxygluconokinase
MATPTSFDVVTYGEALAVFAAAEAGPLARAEHFVKGAAGAELNVAIGLARLGLRVGWLSRVGRDSLGQFVLDTLAAEGIDVSAVTVDPGDPPHPTGFYLKSRSVDGSDPEIEYFRAGSAASLLSVLDYQPDWFARARHVHLSGVAPAISASSQELALHIATIARAAGQRISFDPNLRPRLWRSPEEMIARVNGLAAQAHWVMPGLEEGRTLTGETTPEAIAKFYLEGGAEGVVIKLGRDGAYVHTADVRAEVPAAPVDSVVDTVGAGDGFAVGFISALLEGHDAQFAAARGNLVGGMAIQAIGDSEGLPTRERLDAAEKAAGFRPRGGSAARPPAAPGA